MRAVALTAVTTLALAGVGACSPSIRTAAVTTGRLDCPARSGDLQRVSAAADGKACDYRLDDGTDVHLMLMPVSAGGAEASLAALENSLKAEAAPVAEGGKPMANPAPATGAHQDAQRALEEAQSDAEAAQAREDDAADKDPETWTGDEIEARVNAKLKEKGLSSGPSGADEAHVDLPGLHIDAGDESAQVRVGPLHIDAQGDNATVRSLKETRLRGEGFSTERRGLRAMFVYAGDKLGGGYSFVGYEAAGPKAGPLAVAVVKSRARHGNHSDIYGDVKRLVRRNGGV